MLLLQIPARLRRQRLRLIAEAASGALAVLDCSLHLPDASVTSPPSLSGFVPPPASPPLLPALCVARLAWQVAWTGASWGGEEGARAPPAVRPPHTGDIVDWPSLTV